MEFEEARLTVRRRTLVGVFSLATVLALMPLTAPGRPAGSGPAGLTARYWKGATLFPPLPPPLYQAITPDPSLLMGTEIEPGVHLFDTSGSLANPFSVEWTGFIQVPSDGSYLFRLESIGESCLYLDGQLAVSNWSQALGMERFIGLRQGRHEVAVRFQVRQPGYHIELIWAPPGQHHQAIQSVYLSSGP